MKKLFAIIPILVVLVVSQAVAQTTPAKEFTVSISEPSIELAPGETKSIDVFVNRSVKYRKAKIKLYIDNKLPEGITASFERAEDYTQADKLILSAKSDAGNYNGTLILKASSARLTKGTMFNLTVGGEETVADGK
ncbi:MAG: hypothetical protein AAGC88_03175 [Bacteroidota bacterium]